MSFSTPAARTVAAGILTLVTSLGVTGCGSDSAAIRAAPAAPAARTRPPTRPRRSSTSSIKGKTITPTNKRIEVSKGKPLTITINSDRSGELHVHSSPEEEIAFDKGTTTKKVTFSTPGVVEVEEHVSDTLIAQLEVR